MSDAVRAEKIAHEVEYAARQLAQAGRLDLTREFIPAWRRDGLCTCDLGGTGKSVLCRALGPCWHFGRPCFVVARGPAARLLSL